jgi:hypothetical protein
MRHESRAHRQFTATAPGWDARRRQADEARGWAGIVIVRYELDDGGDTYATVPASVADQIGDMQALADALLVAIPRAVCIQVWADGRSFLDPPDAEARSPRPDPAPAPSALVLDVATAIMLTEADRTAPLAGAPAWLTRSHCTPRLGPQVLRGRAAGATGTTPPV